MIAPLALIGLIALPVIVAFYMLRLRRRNMPVGSTFLWQQLVRDVEANAPWQRLRFSWLLLVQLLIAALVVVAATRPFASVTSDLAANVVLIVDTSASMSAVDNGDERIQLARTAARGVIDRLPEGGRITVVAADDTAHVVAAETDDRTAALEAIEGIEPTQVPGDLTDAFALASALAQRDSDSTIVVVTDATGDRLPPAGVGAPVIVVRVGETDANQAVSALSALRRSGGAQLDLFVAITNHASADITRRLEIYADGELVDARDMAVPAGERSEALVSTVPPAAQVVEARLAGDDALAVDDRAFALVPPQGTVRALLVSDGSAYLEGALALLPRLELYAVGTDGYADAIAEADDADEPYGLLIFDGMVPDDVPDIPALYVDPDEDGTFGTAGRTVNGPTLAQTDPADAILRFVDLTTVHIGRARVVELADGMRSVVESTAGDPLVAVGQIDAKRQALLAFDLNDTDLPLQVAFPLLMSNIVDFLLPPGDGLLPPSMELGEPITIQVDPRLAEVELVEGAAPGQTDGLPAQGTTLRVVGGSVTLPAARAVGVRQIWADSILPDGTDVPELGGRLGETAVNLFTPDESDVAPGDPRRIVEMGRVTDTPQGPRQPARAEWWWPIALAALALLALEWLLFHRPTRRSLARLVWRRPPLPAVGRGR